MKNAEADDPIEGRPAKHLWTALKRGVELLRKSQRQLDKLSASTTKFTGKFHGMGQAIDDDHVPRVEHAS